MPKRPSWKEITQKRRKENFVGRAEQVRAFQENFDGDIPKYMIFSITGEGGVGKSTLLNRFKQKAEEIKANVLICDDRQTAPVEVMGQVAEQLAKLGIKHAPFDERHKKYRELRQQMESDPNAPRSVLDVVGHGVADLAIMGLSSVPGMAPFTSRVDSKAAGNVVADLMQYTASRWTNKDEVLLVREPEKALTPLFVELLDKATEAQRLILMLDVFERTGKSLSPWLLALFNFEYGELNAWLTFILSGRDPLEQHWTEQAGNICHARLEPFDEDETRLYLSNQGITDEALVKQIYQDTKGLPVLLELLAATNPEPGAPLADITKDAVDRFLLWTPAEMRNVALLAAIPRQFNQDVLAALLGEENAPALFAWLAEQSYIRSDTERGWFYHEKVRELMLRYQRKAAPAEVEKSQMRLAEHFAALLAKLALPTHEAYENNTWRQYEAERVYHLFSAAPEQYWAQVVWAFLPAFFYRSRFAGRLAKLAQQVMDEVKYSRLQQDVVELSNLVSADENDDYSQIIQSLDILQKLAIQNDVASSLLFLRRGIAYVFMNKYDKALKDLDRTFTLDNERLSAVVAIRGFIYVEMKRYDEALMDLNRAIELDEKSAWAIAQRGNTHRLMKKYEEALIDFNRAIELDEKNAWAIAVRGQTYNQMKRYEEALTDFNSANELDEKSAWTIAARGETYRLMKRYDEALTDFNITIELDEKDVWTIARRGQTYRLIERYDEALLDFNRAIELDEKSAWAIASRGETYRLMELHDEALLDFNRAIELDEKDAWIIANRGETYRLIKRYDEALLDFSRAIELDEKYAWAIASRGQTYRSMKRYDEALLDFNRAIELDGKDASKIASRGETYRLMKRYDEALIDFNRAIELDEKYTWAIAYRGQTYRSMKRYSEALLDFNRAIELNEKYAWAINNRGKTYYEMGKYEQALIDFDWMIIQDQGNVDTEMLFMRAEILRRLKRFLEALNDFNRIFLLRGDSIDIHHLARRALTFKMMENYEAAKIDLEKALSMPYKDTRDHYNRAAALLVNDQLADALIEFDLAFVDTAPRDYAATDDLLDPIRELPEYQALLAKYGKA